MSAPTSNGCGPFARPGIILILFTALSCTEWFDRITVAFVSAALAAMGFCESMRTYPTKDQMADYLEKYAQRFGLPVRLGIDVLGLTRNEREQFVVECADRRIEADQVIVATGAHATQRKPSFVAISTHRSSNCTQASIEIPANYRKEGCSWLEPATRALKSRSSRRRPAIARGSLAAALARCHRRVQPGWPVVLVRRQPRIERRNSIRPPGAQVDAFPRRSAHQPHT